MGLARMPLERVQQSKAKAATSMAVPRQVHVMHCIAESDKKRAKIKAGDAALAEAKLLVLGAVGPSFKAVLEEQIDKGLEAGKDLDILARLIGDIRKAQTVGVVVEHDRGRGWVLILEVESKPPNFDATGLVLQHRQVQRLIPQRRIAFALEWEAFVVGAQEVEGQLAALGAVDEKVL